VAATLRSLGFEVILKENLSKDDMVAVISDFSRRLRNYAVGLFYFAGHGFMSTQKDNYLMGTGVKEDMTEAFAKSNSIALEDVMGSMEEAQSTATKILMIDACRNNPFRSWGRGDQKGLGSVTAPDGLIAFFAASPNEEASENPGKRNGLFTQELLTQLKTPNLSFDDLIRNTTNAVKRQNPSQRPYRMGDLSDVFYFNPKGTPPPAPTRLVSGTTKDLPFGPRMVYVEGGTFEMGSNEGDADEKPVHSVTLSDFWMAQTEVTVGQYLEFCTATNSHWPEWLEKGNSYHVETGSDRYYAEMGYSRQATNLPIVGVSWLDAVAYAHWLTQKTGLRYGLPTEAQWEYAARGGRLSKGHTYSGSSNIGEVAWTSQNANSGPQPVGQKAKNELGLYDLSGNVWEWCSDWKDTYLSSAQTNPTGPATGTSRVVRGGSWSNSPDYALVAARYKDTPDLRIYNNGFRVVSQLQ
jgi:formylglycine-generating enzyme required for sulfatase activity